MTLPEKIPGGIIRVQIIPTGFAISVHEEGRIFLLFTQAKELAGDGYLEAPKDYHRIVMPQIPSRLGSLDETERITATKPLMTKLSQHQVETDYYSSHSASSEASPCYTTIRFLWPITAYPL